MSVHNNVIVEKRGDHLVVIFEAEVPELAGLTGGTVVTWSHCNDDGVGRNRVGAIAISVSEDTL